MEGLDLDEGERDPYAHSDGFYPLLAGVLDYPFPTIAALDWPHFRRSVPTGARLRLSHHEL